MDQPVVVRMYLSSFRLGNDPQVFLRLLGERAEVLVVANGLDGEGLDTRAERVRQELERCATSVSTPRNWTFGTTSTMPMVFGNGCKRLRPSGFVAETSSSFERSWLEQAETRPSRNSCGLIGSSSPGTAWHQ
jgi:hypothetical protein